MLTSPSNALHSTPHFWPIHRSRLCRSRNFPRFHSGERSDGGKFCSLSLLSASGAGKFSVRALVKPDDGDSDGDGTLAFPNHISVKVPFENREILVETGLMGRQASSAVTVTDGETVLSYDGLHAPDALVVTSAGIVVALSEVPNSKAIAGVQVGLIGGEFIVNPTVTEMEKSQLDLFLVGTYPAILTIEGYSNFLPEEVLLQAVKVGQLHALLLKL